MKEIRLIGLTTMPEVKRGDDLVELIADAASREGVEVEDGDIVVVSSKLVSKAKGYGGSVAGVTPSRRALALAKLTGKDPVEVEAILGETKRLLGCIPIEGAERRYGIFRLLSADEVLSDDLTRSEPCLLLTIDRTGRTGTDAGLDFSNAPPGEYVVPPPDPDAEAEELAEGLKGRLGVDVAVVLTDTEFTFLNFLGTVDVAVGIHGMDPVNRGFGGRDRYGRAKFGGVDVVADEVAAAAALLMGQSSEGIPIVVLKGLRYRGRTGRPVPRASPEILRYGIVSFILSSLKLRLAPLMELFVRVGRRGG